MVFLLNIKYKVNHLTVYLIYIFSLLHKIRRKNKTGYPIRAVALNLIKILPRIKSFYYLM